MPLVAGTRLGVYEVIAPLGAGGMGEVYRARDSRLGREVAVKVLPDAWTTDPERTARLEREAQLLASLNHPHITSLYGIEQAEGALWRPYDVMPDGKKIIITRVPQADAKNGATPRTEIDVVLNWIEELKARVPTK